MNTPISIVWFRQDLRLADNPALQAAIARGGPVTPVFLWAPGEEGDWAPGGASRWWLHQSLGRLAGSLRGMGSRLIVRTGPDSQAMLEELIRETGATALFWNRRYEPAIIARDSRIKTALGSQPGMRVESFNGALLHEPWTIANKSEKPFQVFTPFWKRCLQEPDPQKPVPAPTAIPGPAVWPESIPLDALSLEPQIDWASGFRECWQPGEVAALSQVREFARASFPGYGENRNRPDLRGTSRLSPHLHFGEISPRQVWFEISTAAGPAAGWRGSQFIAEVGWREFAHHLLYHFPATPTEPLRENFRRFPWRTDVGMLKAWRKGETGYPLVDAGMRELWTTGWMHNRVRMVVASFLVKHLLISWREGAAWFWDTLVDADLAQNTLGWQWTAGCGADAAPYFRVFNPTSQGEKFDPKGDYVRRWCPELAKLPDAWVHQPAAAPADVPRRASVVLGTTYPHPIVPHAIAREVALAAFSRINGAGTEPPA